MIKIEKATAITGQAPVLYSLPIKAANDKETRERKAACKLDPDYAAHVMAFHDWYEKYGAGRKRP